VRGDGIIIKGTRKGLVILLDARRDFEELKKKLEDRLASAKDFFSGASFTLSPNLPMERKKIEELECICRTYGLAPYQGEQGDASPGSPAEKGVRESPVSTTIAELELPVLFREGNLRNGQELIHPGHVVILGNIHPGATVKASGHILVLGSIYGSVHAGMEGEKKAAILALKLRPCRLSIGGVPASLPEGPKIPPGPQIARFIDGAIVIHPITAPWSPLCRSGRGIYPG